MILGRGTAKTYDAIIAEYYQFLRDTVSELEAKIGDGCGF